MLRANMLRLMMIGLFTITLAGCGKPETENKAAADNDSATAKEVAANGTDAKETEKTTTKESSTPAGNGLAEIAAVPVGGPGLGEPNLSDDEVDEMWAEYPRQGQPPAEAISVDDFNTSWQTDLKIEGQPAGEVLAKLAGEIGLTFEKTKDAHDALIKNVSVTLEKGTRLQAIEDVCRQIGMTPAYFPKTLKLKPEPRRHPVAFAGPFLIHLSELEERPPYAIGQLSVRMYGAGLPATVGAAVDGDDSGGLLLTAVVDAAGNGLVDAEEGNRAMARSAGKILDTSTGTLLKNLVKSVETLSVHGSIQFKLPTKVTVAKFEKLETGVNAKAGSMEFTIKEIMLGEESNISVNFKGLNSSQAHLVCYDADGNTLVGYENYSRFGNEGNIGKQLEGKLASLEVRIIEATSDVSYEFALQDVPLASFAKMPEKIEPLNFDGDTPATFEFVKFEIDGDEKEMVFKVSNHSNKSVQGFEMTLVFLDADGKAIEELPYTLGWGIEPIVDAGKSKELKLSAFLMPENAKSATMTVNLLRCSDATTWKRADK